MLPFDAIVFGAFVGFLTDFWLARATLRDPVRLIVSVVVFVVVAVFTYVGRLEVF